jgi:DNA-binding transcriptional LysR family regulator
MVSFEWYRSFIAVYRSGTVTGAAEARNLTQPAISQHIVALESQIGQQLFQRAPRKMLPTDHAKQLYSLIAPSMDSLEKISISFRETASEELVPIRLGVPLDYFYIQGIDKLKSSQVQLLIEVGDTEQMIDKLSLGELDAVIATQQIRRSHLDYLKIAREEFCLVAPPDIQLPKADVSDQIPSDELESYLLKQNWISYSSELPIIRRFWHSAFNHRPRFKPIMIVPSLLAIHKAVEAGMGLSVLPRYLCEQSLQNGKMHILWQPDKVSVNDLWLVNRKVDRNNPEIGHLISLLD